MNEEPIAVTDAIFEKAVIGSKLPVLLDCWAPWCAPCRMIAPIVEDIARDYRNRLTVAKLNVDENPNTAGRLDIKSIPSLLLFKNGSIAGRIVGAVPRQEIERHIQTMLGT